tara:strand:- start:1698 stop:2099 length:402 start_codon:yes stop_codon:yes gene_type:complete
MKKSYLAKIIAKDTKGLQTISACCSEANIKVGDIKYLKKNKIFLLSLQRFNKEEEKYDKKINSICKFEFVDKVKSKNIDQINKELIIELLAIDILKKENNFEISLLFKNNAFITLSTEIIEVTLEDQNKLSND